MEVFGDTRSKNAVIKRMIQLGLIAERSEILPSKRKKSKKSMPSNGSDSESGDSDTEDSDAGDTGDTRRVKVTIRNVRNSKKSTEKVSKQKQPPTRQLAEIKINVDDVKRQITEIDESIKVQFAWIQESLNDAAEDADDNDDLSDPSDGVPIVPFSMAQKEALENSQFKNLLLGLGLQEPIKDMVNTNVFIKRKKNLLILV